MTFIKMIAVNIPATILFVVAAWLCHEERDGWGWFLFAAIICFHWFVKSKDGSDDQCKP